MIKNIIFDLGKVLIDYDWTILYKKLNNKLTEEDLSDSVELLLEFDAGKMTAKEFYLVLKSKFELNISFPEFKVIWCDIFQEIPEMIAFAEILRKKYQLYLFSNTDELHFPYIWEKFPALHIFGENLMLSYQLKSVKPYKEIYVRALEKFKLNAAECILIDDKAENIEGARQVGMQGIRHRSISSTISELRSYGII